MFQQILITCFILVSSICFSQKIVISSSSQSSLNDYLFNKDPKVIFDKDGGIYSASPSHVKYVKSIDCNRDEIITKRLLTSGKIFSLELTEEDTIIILSGNEAGFSMKLVKNVYDKNLKFISSSIISSNSHKLGFSSLIMSSPDQKSILVCSQKYFNHNAKISSGHSPTSVEMEYKIYNSYGKKLFSNFFTVSNQELNIQYKNTRIEQENYNFYNSIRLLNNHTISFVIANRIIAHSPVENITKRLPSDIEHDITNFILKSGENQMLYLIGEYTDNGQSTGIAFLRYSDDFEFLEDQSYFETNKIHTNNTFRTNSYLIKKITPENNFLRIIESRIDKDGVLTCVFLGMNKIKNDVKLTNNIQIIKCNMDRIIETVICPIISMNNESFTSFIIDEKVVVFFEDYIINYNSNNEFRKNIEIISLSGKKIPCLFSYNLSSNEETHQSIQISSSDSQIIIPSKKVKINFFIPNPFYENNFFVPVRLSMKRVYFNYLELE